MNTFTRGSILVLPWLVLMPLLTAEEVSRQSRSSAYAYVAPSGTSRNFGDMLSMGGGGEGFVYKGLAIGGDLGYLASRRYFGEGIGLASLNASYHFLGLSPSGKFVPFVTLGPTVGFRGRAALFANYGGGVTYWFRDRMGLRLEARQLYRPDTLGHLSFRVGISFR